MSSKLERLSEHAKEMNYTIDHELIREFQNGLADANINIRVPSSLKDSLKAEALKCNIPYQRFVKSILIESLSKIEKDVSWKALQVISGWWYL